MTNLNVVRVRKRRQRWNTEPHLGAQGLLLVLGGLLTLFLLWGFFGPGWATLVAMLAAALAALVPWVRGSMYTTHPTRHSSPVPDHNKQVRSVDTTQAMRHHPEVHNYERRFQRLGLLILVLAPFLVLVFSVPRETYQEWVARANTPEPRDCDWLSAPVGDKHCHYESSFSHVNDQQGEHVIAV